MCSVIAKQVSAPLRIPRSAKARLLRIHRSVSKIKSPPIQNPPVRISAVERAPADKLSFAGNNSEKKLAAIINPAAVPCIPSTTGALHRRNTKTSAAPSAVIP